MKRVASLPAGVEAELRKEIAELWRMARGAVIRVVHCLKDPHLPFGWQHGGRGGLGAVPIGDAKAWAVQEAGAIDMHAERAKRAARVQALEAGTPKRSPLLTAVGNEAYKAEAAKWQGCFEWLRARHMELHFDVRHGPVVLSKGEAPWTNEDRGLQIMAVPDFRELFPPDHEFRVALRGLEHAFGSWEALRAHRLNSDFTVQQAMDAYGKPTSHSNNFRHFHDWTACHALSIAGRAVRVRRGVIHPRFSEPDGKAAFRALFDGLVAPILPFVWYARFQLVPARYWSTHPDGAEVYSSGWTYVGINFFADGRHCEEAPGFAAWFDPGTLLSHGLHYHGDRGNTRFRFGAVVVMGNFEYFHQHYPAFNCTLYTPGWCLLLGDYSDLWHAVGPGTGFRVSITLFDHEVCTFGVRSQDGYVMDWSRMVDQREGDEKYEPEIGELVWYAHEYARHRHRNEE